MHQHGFHLLRTFTFGQSTNVATRIVYI